MKAHYRDTTDAVDLPLPAYYSAVAGPPTGATRDDDSDAHETEPVAATDAERMCADALASTKTVLNAMETSVQEVRDLVVGVGARTARRAFATADGTDRAAWCWTGGPTNFTLFAVGPDSSAVLVEGLRGDTFVTTPAPGPAPIP